MKGVLDVAEAQVPRIFRKMEKIKPLYDWTYKILMFVCRILLISDIVITCWSVAGRYIPFITDPHWSEEVVLTLMVYMTVLSASLAIRRGAHIRMTAFDSYLPKKAVKVLDLVADVAVLVLGVFLVIYGIRFCNSPLSLRGKYASIPHPEQVLAVSAGAGGGHQHDHLRAGADLPASGSLLAAGQE